MGARQNAGGEQGRRRAVQGAIGSARDLVQRAQRQPAARQPVVDFRHPKGQNPARNPVPGLDPADLFAQGVHLGGGGGHGWNNCIISCMFLICSKPIWSQLGSGRPRRTRRLGTRWIPWNRPAKKNLRTTGPRPI